MYSFPLPGWCQASGQLRTVPDQSDHCVGYTMYSKIRNYAPPFDEKQSIFTEKVFPVFSERVFWACFGIVM